MAKETVKKNNHKPKRKKTKGSVGKNLLAPGNKKVSGAGRSSYATRAGGH